MTKSSTLSVSPCRRENISLALLYNREQNRDLFLAFIDLTKVNRDLLWQVLSKFGCPPNFLTILQEFHNNMKTKVVVGGRMSGPFDVLVGVKQGCVLVPVINFFLVSVTLASPL